jgi:hypothetical protein
MSRKARVTVLVAVAALAIFVGVWFMRWLAIDRCLDAGGRWNYATRACEFAPTR